MWKRFQPSGESPSMEGVFSVMVKLRKGSFLASLLCCADGDVWRWTVTAHLLLFNWAHCKHCLHFTCNYCLHVNWRLCIPAPAASCCFSFYVNSGININQASIRLMDWIQQFSYQVFVVTGTANDQVSEDNWSVTAASRWGTDDCHY